MLRKIVTALLAAAAFAPAVQAQEMANDGEARHHEGQYSERREAPQRPVEARPAPSPSQAAPAYRPQRQPDAPHPAVNVQAQGQARFDGRGGGDWRQHGDARVQGQVSGQPQAAPEQVQPQGDPRQRDRNAGQAQAYGRFDGRGGQTGADPRRDDARTEAYRRQSDDRRAADLRREQDQRRGDDQRRFEDQRRFDVNRNGAYARNDWNRGWREDHRFDWNRYRATNRDLFRLPRYYAPYDWHYGYRRFSIGVTLSSLLWSQDYWIDDPIYYRLPPAYGPYRWVRYYNDALLVDVRSGYVVDTVYDIFW